MFMPGRMTTWRCALRLREAAARYADPPEGLDHGVPHMPASDVVLNG